MEIYWYLQLIIYVYYKIYFISAFIFNLQLCSFDLSTELKFNFVKRANVCFETLAFGDVVEISK